MTAKSKEVVEFMTAFAFVRDACRNDPSKVRLSWTNSKDFREVSERLYWSAYTIRLAERSRRELYAINVGEDFRESWRDFEDRWENAVDVIGLILETDITVLIGSQRSGDGKTPSKLAIDWENADEEAGRLTHAFEAALQAAEHRVEQTSLGDERKTHEEWEILDGVEAWRSLRLDGDGLRGIFRRRLLAPFFNLPQPCPKNVFRHLREAQETFEYGALVGTAALLRSCLESVLKERQGAAERQGLKKRIEQLDTSVSNNVAVALKYLNETACDVLHGNEGAQEFLSLSPKDAEVRMLEHFLVLRVLIEQRGRERAAE